MARLTREEYEERLRKIRLLIMDVDGVLTTGEILLVGEELEGKAFYVRDGSAMYIARLIGIETAAITGRTSAAVERRMSELPVGLVRQGAGDKVSACVEIQENLGVADEEVAFIADDLIDFPLLEHCGLSIAVADAHERLLDEVDWVTSKPGGKGAVREVVDDIVTARDLWDTVIDDYRRRQGGRKEAPVAEGQAG